MPDFSVVQLNEVEGKRVASNESGFKFHYQPYDGKRNRRGRTEGTCAIRAIANAMKLPMSKVRRELCAIQGKRVGAFYRSTQQLAIEIYFDRRQVKSKKLRGISVKSFALTHPVGRFVVNCNTHTTSVIDGVLYDSWNSSGKHVKSFYDVTDLVRR